MSFSPLKISIKGSTQSKEMFYDPFSPRVKAVWGKYTEGRLGDCNCKSILCGMTEWPTRRPFRGEGERESSSATPPLCGGFVSHSVSQTPTWPPLAPPLAKPSNDAVLVSQRRLYFVVKNPTCSHRSLAVSPSLCLSIDSNLRCYHTSTRGRHQHQHQ